MQFHGARLKVDRANKHIEEIDRNIRNLSDPDTHSVTAGVDPHTGQKLIHYDIPQNIPTNLALVIGDAVHTTPSTKLMTLFKWRRIGRGVRENSSSPPWA